MTKVAVAMILTGRKQAEYGVEIQIMKQNHSK